MTAITYLVALRENGPSCVVRLPAVLWLLQEAGKSLLSCRELTIVLMLCGELPKLCGCIFASMKGLTAGGSLTCWHRQGWHSRLLLSPAYCM